MTALLDRFRAAYRAFVIGPAVVDLSDTYHGRDPETFSPAKYGDYIATSNGVYTCATLRADLLATLPLKLYKLRRGGRKEEVNRGELFDLMHKVNPFWTFKRLVKFTELSRCLWGSSYWFLERGPNGKGMPREIWWGRPDKVVPHPHPVNYMSHYTYRPLHGGLELEFRPDEVIRFALPNPIDEYQGLSPLAAARLSADYASAAMKANVNLHEQGLQLGGYMAPPTGIQSFTEEQARELERAVDRRFRGVDKAHRWAIFRFDAQVKSLGVTPKDAEFLAGLKWSLEDVCRAYKIPLDLIGGQRTYENVEGAMRALWSNCLIPEADDIAGDITEQLLPMFPGVADLAEFDTSGVAVLHEAEAAKWTRAKEQIEKGAITVNEWRDEQGLDPKPWGDAWWASVTLTPITSSTPPEPPAPDETPTPPADEPARARVHVRATIEYGSEEHRALWQRFVRRTGRYEELVTAATTALFKRQQDSVIERLKSQGGEKVAAEPFDRGQWVRTFREEIRPVLKKIITDSAEEALDDLRQGRGFRADPVPVFMPEDPAAVRFLEGRAQRFATQVNETTWTQLQESLGQGMKAGESVSELSERVLNVMAGRIRSTPETIARTEVIGANNGGTLLAWEQSDLVEDKTWIAALDDRTRDSHIDAHNQTVKLGEDFEVGSGKGPHPGAIGLAEEDINCFPADTAVKLLPGGDAVGMTRRFYDGLLYEITTAHGHQLAGTPNHPILTDQGWVPLRLLKEGDYVVSRRPVEEMALRDPDVNDRPTTFGELFDLLSVTGARERVRGVDQQFHGDGRDGDVDIVAIEGELERWIQAASLQPAGQQGFTLSHLAQCLLPGPSLRHAPFGRNGLPTNSLMRGLGEASSLVGIGSAHTSIHGSAAVADLNTTIEERAPERRSGEPGLFAQLLERYPGLVTADQIIGVRQLDFRGHVFNLQTDSGLYIANSIISHNCRCAMIAGLKEERSLVPELITLRDLLLRMDGHDAILTSLSRTGRNGNG